MTAASDAPVASGAPAAAADASATLANGDGELLLRAEHVTKHFSVRRGILLLSLIHI